MTQDEMPLEQVANSKQVGGNHYKKHILEHWDTVALFDLDYFQGNAWKYLLRWRDKGGIPDLEKSKHYIEKYIEIETLREQGTLTRSLLERAIRELEGIEGIDADEAAYRAAAKGDDPVGDALSHTKLGFPDRERDKERDRERFANLGVLSTEKPEGPLEVGDAPDDDIRFGSVSDEPEPELYPHAHPDRTGCTHDSIDCPVHPNGGCPPAPQPASAAARP